MTSAKIIGFDAWTLSNFHYARLVDAFRTRDLDLQIIHLGSWGNEPGRASEETLGGIRVRDVAAFGRLGLDGILALERPAVVVFLSTDSFAHRAINRYCRRRGIPTVHVFHGLHGCVNVDANVAISVPKRLWLLRQHLFKQVRHYLPAYVRALWTTGARWSDWRRFMHDVGGRFIGSYETVAAEDSRADQACVYIDSEADFAVRRYGYSRAAVSVVGNPDLLMFGVPPELVGCALGKASTDFRDVMYLDSGLVDVGFVYGSPEDFVAHIARTGKDLATQGYRLVIKPHPIHFGTPTVSAIADAGVDVCANSEFVARLRCCRAAIVEPSSLALIPCLTGMPVLSALYGALSPERFGELLRSYPRNRPLTELSKFDQTVADAAATDAAATHEWIDRHTGPLPAASMPDRVATVVRSLVLRHADIHVTA